GPANLRYCVGSQGIGLPPVHSPVHDFSSPRPVSCNASNATLSCQRRVRAAKRSLAVPLPSERRSAGSPASSKYGTPSAAPAPRQPSSRAVVSAFVGGQFHNG